MYIIFANKSNRGWEKLYRYEDRHFLLYCIYFSYYYFKLYRIYFIINQIQLIILIFPTDKSAIPSHIITGYLSKCCHFEQSKAVSQDCTKY